MTQRAPWWRYTFTRDAWRRILYALLSLPLGVVYAVVALVCLFMSLYAMLVVVGFFLLAGTMVLAARLGRVERARARALLGTVTADPPRREPVRAGTWARAGARIRDAQSWKEFGYLLLTLPLGALTGAAVLLSGALLLRAAVYPFEAIPGGSYKTDWGGPTLLGAVTLHSGQGVLIVVFAPLVIRALTELHAAVVRALLGAATPTGVDAEASTVDDVCDGTLDPRGGSTLAR